MNLHRYLASLVVVATLAPASGCYFGRSKEAKRGAYVANGMLLAAAGAVVLASALDGEADCPSGDASCGWGAVGDAYAGLAIASVLGGAGAIGVGINLLVPTNTDAPPALAPITHATPPVTATVTAPGLTPASVQLR